jgi:hypothetical protein
VIRYRRKSAGGLPSMSQKWTKRSSRHARNTATQCLPRIPLRITLSGAYPAVGMGEHVACPRMSVNTRRAVLSRAVQ